MPVAVAGNTTTTGGNRRRMIDPVHSHARLPMSKSHTMAPHPMEPPRKKARRSTTEPMSSPVVGKAGAEPSLKRNASYRTHMYLTFVKNALLERRKGRNEPYEELVTQFAQASKPDVSTTTTSLDQLRSWLDALSHVVSQLDKLYASLIDAVLGLPWSTADESFVKSYTAFVGLLVSARPEYLATVLDRNVRGYTFNSGLRAVETLGQDGSTQMTRATVYDRQHSLTIHLLSLIPTLPASLFPVLSKHFPHKREPKHAQVTYIRNLLRISSYCPQLSGRILGLVVERAVMIDVEVQIAYEDLETGASAGEAEGVFDLDPFDLVVGENVPDDPEADEGEEDEDIDLSDISSEGGPEEDLGAEKQTADPVKHAAIHAMVTKLDAILKLLFNYFERVGQPSLDSPRSVSGSSTPTTPLSELPPPLTLEARHRLVRAQFLHLLSIFDRTILPTFRTRYTQFLLFYFTSLDASFADLFQGLLLQKALFEPDQTPVVRLASVSYVAGFVSRANCVDRDNARRVVSLLCEFLGRRLDNEDDDPKDNRGEAFYAITQAIMVIFCFRWRDLQDGSSLEEQSDEEREDVDIPAASRRAGLWMPELSVMQRAVTSPLNPLKHCFKHVVHQFAAVAKHTNFLYCHSIIEANRRALVQLSDDNYSPASATPTRTNPHPFSHSHGLASIRLTQAARLDSFFPFDPYTLPQTEEYIEGLYRTWAQAKPDGFDDDETDGETDGETEEEEETEEDEDEEEPTSDPATKSGLLVGMAVPGHEMLSGSWKSSSDSVDEEAAEQLGKSFGGLSISPVATFMRPAGSR